MTKRILLVLTIFIAATTALWAAGEPDSVAIQDARNRVERPSAEERSKSTTEFLAMELGLSNEQKSQCELIYVDFYRDLDVLIEDDLSRFKLMRKIKSLQKVTDLEIEKILTPAQYKEFEEIQEEIKKKKKESEN